MFLVYVACFVSLFQSHVGRQASHQINQHPTFNTQVNHDSYIKVNWIKFTPTTDRHPNK